MHLADYLDLLAEAQRRLADAYRGVARTHADEPDVEHQCLRLAGQCDAYAAQLRPFVERYAEGQPEHPHVTLFHGPRSGSLGLLRDLHDLYLAVTECDISWIVVSMGAQGARDTDLHTLTTLGAKDSGRQLAWLRTRVKQATPQTLVVA